MSFGSSPYQPPAYDAWKSPPSPPRVPAVWYWYVAYCVAMALLYLACLAGGIALFGFAEEIAAKDRSSSPNEFRVMGVMFILISLPLTLLFVIAPVLKGKVGWILGFVTIGIGLTSACCLPASVPLLIYWLKPELKAYLRVP